MLVAVRYRTATNTE